MIVLSMGLHSDRRIHTDWKTLKLIKIGISGKMISSTFLSSHQKNPEKLNQSLPLCLFCMASPITTECKHRIVFLEIRYEKYFP